MDRPFAPPIVWRQPLPQGEIVFELHADDPALLARAACVLGHGARGEGEVHRRFHVYQDPSAEWVVRAEWSGEELRAAGRDEAVMLVEFAAARAVVESPDAAGVHAALLDRAGRGVLVVGRPEAGKSTLACALWQAGWSLLSDDYAMVDGRRAIPAGRRVSLRSSSRALVGDATWDAVLAAPSCSPTRKGVIFHPREVDGREAPAFTELAAIVFLARLGFQGEPARPVSLAPPAALLALLPYCNLPRIGAAGAAIERLAPLAGSVPAFDLARGPLAEMVAALDDLVERSTLASIGC